MLRLTREQLREIDRRSVEEYYIPSIVLMENAARAVVDAVITMAPARSKISLLCGVGNNAGDAFAIARHLHNRGFDPTCFLITEPDQLKGDALLQNRIIDAMGLCQLYAHNFDKTVLPGADAELWIDGLFGTGLTRTITGVAADLIEIANASSTPILAIDVPSGLDCDAGKPLGPCIKATRTVTFVAEKLGFANPASKQYTGEIIVGDIGCPRELIEQVAKEVK